MGSMLTSPANDSQVAESNPKAHLPIETKIEEDAHIKSYVKSLLKSGKLNNKYIPDYMEEKMYEQLLERIIIHFKQILSEAKIEFLDHEIRFCLVPKSS